MIRTFIARQLLCGKTIARALFNAQVACHAPMLSGDALDLASGGAAGYLRFMPAGVRVLRTDLQEGEGVAQVVDLEKSLPFEDSCFDHVFLFNALYAIKEPEHLIREIHRILRQGGTALIASPFLSNEMPEPHDYRRLTREGLEDLFTKGGFGSVGIEPYGERFSVMANLLHPFLLFPIVRTPVCLLALLLDRCIPAKTRRRYPAPIGYFCILTK